MKKNRKTYGTLQRLCALTVAVFLVLICGACARKEIKEQPTLRQETEYESAIMPAIAGSIAQVLPLSDKTVAVLYVDGTVAVIGDPQKEQAVSGWENVVQLSYDSMKPFETYVLIGLTKDGRVLLTEGELPQWTDIKSVHTTYEGIAGVRYDGTVVTYGEWEQGENPAQLTNVETLVMEPMGGCLALKKDGSVESVPYFEGYDSGEWENMRQIFTSYHSTYGIREDGTVVSGLAFTTEGLTGTVKLVTYDDWLFGLSPDGRLLTESGKLYSYGGVFCMNWHPGVEEFEVDISGYRNVKDILAANGGIILLNRDGTVDAINVYGDWDFSNWQGIEKVYCNYFAEESSDYIGVVYGLRGDGSVIAAINERDQTDEDNYKGWTLREIVPGHRGVIGITTEGKLVGDGGYAELDFSVLERP